MKNTGVCPKCERSEIIRTAGKKHDHDANKIRYSIFRKIPLDHFTCVNCGYTEEWVTNEKELDFLRKKYQSNPSKENFTDFV